MGKRSIRLKEMTPDIDVQHDPSPEYRATADSSLPAGPFRARTDSDGFLITGNHTDPAAAPIAFLGDSFVESMFVGEELRFVSDIERQLETLGTPFRCLNGGYSGATSLQLLSVLVNKVFPVVGEGGRVVFYVPQSDIDSLLLASTYWNSHKRSTALVPGKEPSADRMPEGLGAARAVLKSVVDVSRNLNVRLVLAASPFRAGNFESDAVLRNKYRRNAAHYARVRAFREDLIAVARSVAEETETPFLDVPVAPEHFYDELHLNETGQKVYADAAAPQLAQLFA